MSWSLHVVAHGLQSGMVERCIRVYVKHSNTDQGVLNFAQCVCVCVSIAWWNSTSVQILITPFPVAHWVTHVDCGYPVCCTRTCPQLLPGKHALKSRRIETRSGDRPKLYESIIVPLD